MLSNSGLVEYVIENQIDLIVSFNQSNEVTFKKLSGSANFTSYEEKTISPTFENTVIKKEINFALDKFDVNQFNKIKMNAKRFKLNFNLF